jgi:hypothetical protein
VTNRWGSKQDLSAYSGNILCADLDRSAMVAALADGIRLAEDGERRAHNHAGSGISTDWRESFREVVSALVAPR